MEQSVRGDNEKTSEIWRTRMYAQGRVRQRRRGSDEDSGRLARFRRRIRVGGESDERNETIGIDVLQSSGPGLFGSVEEGESGFVESGKEDEVDYISNGRGSGGIEVLKGRGARCGGEG